MSATREMPRLIACSLLLLLLLFTVATDARTSLRWTRRHTPAASGDDRHESALYRDGDMPPSLQWGKDGHEMVAHIAQALLSQEIVGEIESILGGDTMAYVAPWADWVKRDMPWSAPLHYIDAPDGACEYVRERDCHNKAGEQGYCVDGAIQNYTRILADRSAPADELTLAMKFLIHFVGDVHQPLHCGWTSDIGGNAYKGQYDTHKHVTLHSLWDSYLLYTRVDNDFGSDWAKYTDFLLQMIHGDWAKEVQKWRNCSTAAEHNACSDEWASESVYDACHYAYVDTDGTLIQDGFVLGDAYYERALPILDTQLAKGGVRLAAILQSLFGDK